MPAPDELLRGKFGFASFRPGQEQVIGHLLAGRSAAAVFPTGAGKSLCYQLPALMLPGLTLVVSPLIALMKDQIDRLKKRGIAAARLDSTLTADENRTLMAALRAGELKMLYVAPERFVNERFREAIQRLRVSLFAVDEAHCISEWGHNFRPDYLKLAQFAKLCHAERVLALTATATPPVLKDICHGFGIVPQCAVRTGFYRANLMVLTTPISTSERDATLVDRLKTRPLGPMIVYVTLQRTAETVAATLAAAGSRRSHITPAWRTTCGPPCRTGSAARTTPSSSPRSRSAWESTRPTSGTSTTTTCRRAWRIFRKRSDGPGATASLRRARCSSARTI